MNAATGTAALSFPLPFSTGRNDYKPPHVLSYDSGSGNSILGLGCGVDIPFIQRKTEKKLPEYKDATDSDVFMFSGIEDLVPVLIKDNSGNWIKQTTNANGIITTFYRPRVESQFSRIEQVADNGNIYWRATTKENVVFVFGRSNDAKIASPVPGEEYKIFKWCLEYTYDDKGSIVQYHYKKENKENVTASLAEKNRLNDIAPFTNTYIKRTKTSITKVGIITNACIGHYYNV